jgi:hypothetical protein
MQWILDGTNDDAIINVGLIVVVPACLIVFKITDSIALFGIILMRKERIRSTKPGGFPSGFFMPVF